MAIKYQGFGDLDIFTIGSNQVAIVDGGAQQDRVLITSNQTADVDLNLDADAKIELQAGVQVANAKLSFGTQIITLSNGAKISAKSTAEVYIGTKKVSMAELKALITDGSYTVTGNEAPAPVAPAVPAFTLTLDDARTGEAKGTDTNGSTGFSATVTDPVQGGQSAVGTTLKFTSTEAFASNSSVLVFKQNGDFYLLGDKVVAKFGSNPDQVIGTYSSTDVQKDATITFTNAAVTAQVIQDLLSNINIGDSDDNGKDLTYTVELTNASGAKSSQSFTIEAAGDNISITGLNATDSREVQKGEDDAFVTTTLVDPEAKVTLVTLPEQTTLEGGKLVLSGLRATDSFTLTNTTDAPVDGQARLVGDLVVIDSNTNGTSITETVIGTRQVADNGDWTISLNSNATAANTAILLNNLAVKLDNSNLNVTVPVTYALTNAAGTETVSDTVALKIIDNFTAISLADLNTLATSSAPGVNKALTGNYLINVPASVSANSIDLSDLVLTGLTSARIQINGNANIADMISTSQGAKGLEVFNGVLSNYLITGAYTLTGTAAQLSGETVKVSKTSDTTAVIVTNMDAVINANGKANADLSKITAETVTANFAESAEFIGILGTANVVIADGKTLTVDASKISARSVTDGSDSANLIVNNLAASTDLSKIDLGGTVTVNAGTLNFAGNLGFTGGANSNSAVVLADGATFTTTAAIASGVVINDGNNTANVAITALDAFKDTHGKGIADLSNINVDGTKTATVSDNVTFTGNLGNFTTSIDANKTFTAAADKVSGKTINGAGNVKVTGLTTTETDLSKITNGGTRLVEASGTLNSATNLGFFSVEVPATKELTLSVTQADARTITGQASTTDNGKGGSIFVTGLDGEKAYDLSKITAGAKTPVVSPATSTGDAGTFKATIAGENSVSLHAATKLGTAELVLEAVNGALTATITAAQADDRVVKGTGGENLTVDMTAAAADLDLSKVDATKIGNFVAQTKGTINLSGMKLGALDQVLVNDGSETTVTDAVVTLTAEQAGALGVSKDSPQKAIVSQVENTASNGELAADTVKVVVTASTLLTGSTGVSYVASAGDDQLAGTNLNDTIDGNSGKDTINGGDGNDIIIGGAGVDSMTGGEGVDTFKFTETTDSGTGTGNRDIITDFADGGLAGGDLIDLSAFDKGTDVAFIGSASFEGATGITNENIAEVRYVVAGGNAIVEVDTDGNGSADFQIQLTGVTTLSAQDFILAAVTTP